MRLTVSTPIGYVSAEGDGEGIHFISRAAAKPNGRQADASKALDTYKKEMKEYFAGSRKAFSVPLSVVSGTPFQRKVWNALRKIPYGSVKTYGDIAKEIGHPKAVRAVGTAVGKNPLAIIIPCHRVVPSSGGIGKFGWGSDIKKKLLDLEKTHR